MAISMNFFAMAGVYFFMSFLTSVADAGGESDIVMPSAMESVMSVVPALAEE